MIPTTWNSKTYKEFINYLDSIKDNKYKEFHNSLVKDSKYEILGVKLPILRNISKDISKTNIEDYLNIDKGLFYEEIMLEGLVISKIKDEKTFYKYFNSYIDKIDNWALCDTFCNSIKIVEKYPDKYYKIALELSKSSKEFRSRVGLIMILSHFINEDNVKEILELVNNIHSDKYYVNMAIAWLIAEIYIKHRKEGLEFIKNNDLDKFTQNKTISKINDSFRVSKEEKEELKKYRKKV